MDELALPADAPVLLCEGEKAADAAAGLMPNYVATCRPNGSNSSHKADLTPLKGRDVLLWPDNDDSGKTCMDSVANKLREIGAGSVRVMALEVFKRKPTMENEGAGFRPRWPMGRGRCRRRCRCRCQRLDSRPFR